ncbi:MAG: formyltransferase [Usitatibacter sp.]
MAARAVVFAYHDVGVRCLSVLLAHGVDVPLVVTHRDDPKENIWFGNVERLAREYGLDTVTPADPAEIAARIQAIAPEFIFSFYYRHMLPPALLGAARRGAYNMHGSLLPRYRGRVPVNWAVLNGERETGATLHEMATRPDAGGIVDQMAVPILPDDTARDVFRKVVVAAEVVMDRALPRLLDGSVRPVPQDLQAGSYYGGRKPEDGRIDWTQPARRIHDLVRAVAPPYPGAFCDVGDRRLRVLRTRVLPGDGAESARPGVEQTNAGLFARCGDGGRLAILEWEWT